MSRRSRFLALVVVPLLALAAGACGDDDDSTTSGGDGTPLAGVLSIEPGQCTDGAVTAGSSFRMVQPGGTVKDGPFVGNGDSPCGDKTWTPLRPGTDGGLRLGSYQPQPANPFDAAGNAASNAIIEPQKWFAVAFGLATNERDPQTNKKTHLPTIVLDGRKLSGDLSALAAAWNGQHFNQGAPKPGGDFPGATEAVTGTFEESTGAYTLTWTSQIFGGPFNNFTGIWRLTGVVKEEDST
jgi:hypothetical protein